MPRTKLTVKGYVQGVGFRHFIKSTADKMKITGFVINRIDGSVEIEAQGDKSSLELFIYTVYKGSSHSDIQQIEKQALEEKQFETGFKVVF